MDSRQRSALAGGYAYVDCMDIQVDAVDTADFLIRDVRNKFRYIY